MSQRIPDDDKVSRSRDTSYKDVSKSKEEQVTDIDLEKRKWSNRRRMAWLAFISMMLVTAALLFAPISEVRIKTLSEPITWFYFAMASIIGAYMGFTTWASKR